MPDSSGRGIHYGWVVVFAGTLCIFACLGLGRFALGMLLPSMGESLHLSYAQMGFVSTANFLGYLVAVLASGLVAHHVGPRRLIVAALVVTGASMVAVGRAGGFPAVLALYLVTGIGSGAANVPMVAVVASWFSRRYRGRAAGFVVAGSGFAILLSGWLIPRVNAAVGAEGWRLSWYILGALVLVTAALCGLLVKDSPAAAGLEPVGGTDPPPPAGGEGVRRREIGAVAHLGAIYFLFGYTYVIYATFIVTALVRERGFPEAVAGQFWSAVGLLSLFSGPIFGTISDHLGRRAGLMAVFAIQACAYALIASGLPGAPLALSIGLFGIAAWSIPSIMPAAVADAFGPARTAKIFGIVTFIFAIGQMAGPAVAGLVAERAGSFRGSFLMAASCAAAAVALSALLRGHGAAGEGRRPRGRSHP